MQTNTLNIPNLGQRVDGQFVQLTQAPAPPAFVPLLRVSPDYALEILSVFFIYTCPTAAGQQVGLTATGQGVTIWETRNTVALTALGANVFTFSQGSGLNIVPLANVREMSIGRVVIPPQGILVVNIFGDQIDDMVSDFVVCGIAWPIIR